MNKLPNPYQFAGAVTAAVAIRAASLQWLRLRCVTTRQVSFLH
jgi:hypothetical protein